MDSLLDEGRTPRRLSDFIRTRRSQILGHWEQVVRTLPRAVDLARPALLDHLPELLEQIAKTSGAEAFTATDKSELDARLGEVLDRLDKTKIESNTELRPYAELFPWFVLAGLVCMGLEGLLRATRFRRYP